MPGHFWEQCQVGVNLKCGDAVWWKCVWISERWKWLWLTSLPLLIQVCPPMEENRSCWQNRLRCWMFKWYLPLSSHLHLGSTEMLFSILASLCLQVCKSVSWVHFPEPLTLALVTLQSNTASMHSWTKCPSQKWYWNQQQITFHSLKSWGTISDNPKTIRTITDFICSICSLVTHYNAVFGKVAEWLRGSNPNANSVTDWKSTVMWWKWYADEFSSELSIH